MTLDDPGSGVPTLWGGGDVAGPIEQRRPSLTAVLLGWITLAMGGCNDELPSAPTVSTPFTAGAGLGRLVTPGTPVSLEAESADIAGLTFSWSLQRPESSEASLSSPGEASTQLIPDVLGSYDVELAVSNDRFSLVDTVNVTALESYCDRLADLLPTPVNAANTPFLEVDDATIGVPFDDGFQFEFFGTAYDRVWVNTNGGVTFGQGEPFWDLARTEVLFPAIAVFWGDMSALSAPRRPAQLYHESCPDRFILYYRDYPDLDDPTRTNTATLTLFANGTITIEYGAVESSTVLVGVMDGTHRSDQIVAVQDEYLDYDASSGVVLFDSFGAGTLHDGRLSGRTITFVPTTSGTTGSETSRTSTPSAAPVRKDPS